MNERQATAVQPIRKAFDSARALTSTTVNHIAEQARSRLSTVGLETLLLDVAKRLGGQRVNIVIVCSADGALAGVISKTDIVRRIGLGEGNARSPIAADLMTRVVHHCRPHQQLSEVLAMMQTHGLAHVPVLDNKSIPLGVVEARDALRALLADEQYEESLLRDYVMGVGYH